MKKKSWENLKILEFISGQCGTPSTPSSSCPIPWYHSSEQRYYWDPNVGNCLPYFGGSGSCSSGNNVDDNVYGSYEDCMSVCSFRQRQEQQQQGTYTGCPNMFTVVENYRKSLIQHCERSELRLHFEWPKIN